MSRPDCPVCLGRAVVIHAMGAKPCRNCHGSGFSPTPEEAMVRIAAQKEADERGDVQEQIYADQKLDILYLWIDTLLLAGRFEEVDRILAAVDVERLRTAVLLGYLTITFAAKHMLDNRDAFYERVRKRVVETEPAKDVPGLLGGLE